MQHEPQSIETIADRELIPSHLIDGPREKMGFHQGCGIATDQLTAVGQKL